MPNANTVEIYYMLDEFSKLFDAALHPRHRSFSGFVANLCSDLIAYSFIPNRPKVYLENGRGRYFKLYFKPNLRTFGDTTPIA